MANTILTQQVEALSGLQGMFGTNQAWGKHVDHTSPDDSNTNKHYKDNEAVEILSTINPNTFLSHQQGVHAPDLLEQINKNGPVKALGSTVGAILGIELCLAPQVPNGPQAEACGSDRVAGNTQSGGLTRDKQSRGLSVSLHKYDDVC